MGIDVTAYLCYGVDIEDRVPKKYRFSENEEGWQDDFYNNEDLVALVRYGSPDDVYNIIVLTGTIQSADWWTPGEITLPEISHIKKQAFIQWLQDHDIQEEPRWLLSAIMW